MKRRVLALLLAVSCVFLCACGGGNNEGNAGNNNQDGGVTDVDFEEVK